MTTVAYHRGVMASDSCMTFDDAIDALVPKMVRLRSGGLLGSAGDNDAREIESMLDRVKTARGVPRRSDLLQIRLDYVGLLVLPDGAVFKIATTHASEAHWGDGFVDDIGAWQIPRGTGGLAAIGTGGLAARVAMMCGKTPAEAVAIACSLDIYSRPPVHTLTLKRKR